MENSVVSPAAPVSLASATRPALGPTTSPARRPWWPRTHDALPVPWWVHVALVAVLLGIDALLYYATRLNPKSMVKLDAVWFVRNAALDVTTAGLFYWNWLVLFPRTLSQGRVAAYLLLALASAGVFSLVRITVSDTVYRLMNGSHPGFSSYQFDLWLGLLLGGVLALVASSGVRMTIEYLQGQRNRRELERQHLLTELGMLKTQINPHFLFNTLNNIYSLTSRKSDRAPEAVLRLAESMRYLLYDSGADAVTLTQELTHLRSFLDLQRLRLPAAEAETAILLTTHGALEAAPPVAPLLLLPLVENAFKHGDLAARPEAIRIELEVEGAELRFSVHNYVAAIADLPRQPGGLGLHNLRRRLELLYPERHELHVRTLPGEYAVELVLQLGGNEQ
ncbi:sensor histidine kinase [Hymenobacter properus]|uniref:Sensor histidine kinase n=1 Tax=Hymenobacter properus TaxID=2791026 RepID=A0A931BDA1_9BACT|nr:sensor histidine kinase [Hymenobacter properus]MBF9141229.1 sensor histidine kinase [Hymenobacter properus]MBR7720038.1 sensor histidine kinase [Microvirga sp. SRT04]